LIDLANKAEALRRYAARSRIGWQRRIDAPQFGFAQKRKLGGYTSQFGWPS
jgi:hypothetical protein